MACGNLWCFFVLMTVVDTLTVGHTGLVTSADGERNLQTQSYKECCTRLPELCNGEYECMFDYATCDKVCTCDSQLPIHMCKAMVQDILQDTPDAGMALKDPKESRISSIATSFTELPSTENNDPVLPSLSLTTSTIATPSLSLVPSSMSLEVSSVVPRHKLASGYDIQRVTPSYQRQTVSTNFNESMVEYYKEKNNTLIENSSNYSTTTSETTSATESSESPEVDPSANFVPPTFDGSSNCDNCSSGRCIMDWPLGLPPVFRCEDKEGDNDKCNKFGCSEHGECVVKGQLISCECRGNYTGTFCEEPCDLHCGELGECIIMNGTKQCRCHWNFTGEGCSEKMPTTTQKVLTISHESEPWTVIGICVGVTVLMFLLMVALPYWGWRRQWLPMRKLVYYFQQYEDDDGREFDAFISYKSTEKDEDFVVHQLYPKLEKELDFKLCMHFRDFPPGAAIADNIIEAIEKSRRTIMILSRAYIESEWCRLEYQKAQHEMLKRKHKIIPILIEDISEVTDMDKNLKQIIDTVTYIHWPGDEKTKELDKFWKLMVCALPKKKKDSSHSETSGNGSSSSDLPLTSVAGSHFHDTLSDEVFSDKGGKAVKTNNRLDKDIISNGTSAKSYDNDVFTLYNDAGVVKNNGIDIPKSDDHIIEIRRLPGNEIKVLRHINLDFHM